MLLLPVGCKYISREGYSQDIEGNNYPVPEQWQNVASCEFRSSDRALWVTSSGAVTERCELRVPEQWPNVASCEFRNSNEVELSAV